MLPLVISTTGGRREDYEAVVTVMEELGLVDSNLQDFIWCSWRPILQSARDSAAGLPIDWDSPWWRDVLARVLQALRNDPEAGFASLFEDYEQFA